MQPAPPECFRQAMNVAEAVFKRQLAEIFTPENGQELQRLVWFELALEELYDTAQVRSHVNYKEHCVFENMMYRFEITSPYAQFVCDVWMILIEKQWKPYQLRWRPTDLTREQEELLDTIEEIIFVWHSKQDPDPDAKTAFDSLFDE